MESDAAREASVEAALSDSSSAFYKGLVKIISTCEVDAERAKAQKTVVTLPFPQSERDVVALEEQFNIRIRVRGTSARACLAQRPMGLVAVLDAALVEMAAVPGRRVLWLDGDLMTMAAVGMGTKLVERTHATPRLSSGYAMEDSMVGVYSGLDRDQINVNAQALKRQLVAGGGEHYWPVVRDVGPRVDATIVNHFKTPAGPEQLAWLAVRRGGVVFGALPFQVDMLLKDEGELACFPGRYYVDRVNDTITLVPSEEPAMTVSHPYSDLMSIITNNSITVCGREFLCEKFMSVRGVIYYTLKRLGADFEEPEVLRTHYYDKDAAAVVVLSFPKAKLSGEGVPIGWERGEVRMPFKRYEAVLSRVMTSTNEVVRPVEVFRVLMDYNNLVLNTLDAAVVADRMPVSDEEDAALAIALQVNWRRHAARGTFNTLAEAVRVRHKIPNATLPEMAFIALSAWWRKPRVKDTGLISDLPIPEIVDACGTDFSVVVRDASPWIQVTQMAGVGRSTPAVFHSWLPRPGPGDMGPPSRKWLQGLLERVKGAVTKKDRSVGDSGGKPVVTGRVGFGNGGFPCVGPVDRLKAVCLEETEVPQPRVECGPLSTLKQALRRKMVVDQGAISESKILSRVVARSEIVTEGVPACPVVPVDPYSAVAAEMAAIRGGLPQRDAVATGYRLAELEVEKNVEATFAINDSKRKLPEPRWVREPRVDMGVEGKRVASQAALTAALFKRNIGVPNNRGFVDLNVAPKLTVQRVIDVCYREGWEQIVERYLDQGMWQPNDPDIESFVSNLDEIKVKAMLKEFFQEGEVSLDRWFLMAKGKVKPSRDADAEYKVDHSQTIMYLESSSTNALYSSMTRLFKRCVDECMRPEVRLNAQESDEEHEAWYNSLESHRKSFQKTWSYASDIKCYDRSQEHPALRVDLEFYRRHGLSAERLALWEQTHGVKKASAMMFGVVLWLVLGGVSGIWKTLLRNGIVNLAALVVATDMKRSDVVMLDIKGDDMDAEFSRPMNVEHTIERMGLTFNLSLKFFSNDIRYMCKQFRIRKAGRWYFMADPWARMQSVCTPVWIGNKQDILGERWESLRAELRHYDNGVLVDEVAEAAQQYYQLPVVPYGFARALSAMAADKNLYLNFFLPPRKVD